LFGVREYIYKIATKTSSPKVVEMIRIGTLEETVESQSLWRCAVLRWRVEKVTKPDKHKHQQQ